MPIIPKPTGGNVVVDLQRSPGFDPVQQGGGPLAAGVESAASDALRIATIEKDRVDTAQTTRAFIDADKVWQTDLFGEDGYMAREGAAALPTKEAAGVVSDGMQRYAEIGEKIAAGLENDDQKNDFLLAWQARARFARENLQSHQTKQRELFEEENHQSGIALESQNAVLAAQVGNDDELNHHIGSIESMMRVRAVEQGKSKAAYEAQRIATLTPVLEEAIAIRVQSDPEGARQLFEDHKGTIDASRHSEIIKTLGFEKLTRDSQMAADAIWSENQFSTLEEMTTQARGRYEGDLRDDVVSRLEARHRSKELSEAREKNDTLEQVFGDARGYITASRTQPVTDVSLEQQKDGYLRQLRGNEKGRQAFEKWWDVAAYGGDVETDFGLYENLMNQPASYWNTGNGGNPVTVSDFRDRIGDTEFKELVKHRRELLEGDSGSAEFNRRVTNSMGRVGLIGVSHMAKKREEKQGQYRQRMRAAREAWMQRHNGDEPTGADLDELIRVQEVEWSKGGLSGFFSVDAPAKDLSDRELLDRAGGAMRAIAVDRASNGGRRQPSLEDVVGHLQILRSEMDEKRRSIPPSLIREFERDFDQDGQDALSRLEAANVGLEYVTGETSR